MTDDQERIEALSSRIVHEDRWIKVRHDIIRRPSGSEGTYTVVEKSDFAVIAAIDNGEVHLVRQYRYPVEGSYWELPQGSCETDDQISPEDLAASELRQETGLVAAHVRHLGSFLSAYGYTKQRCHVFFATGLSHVGQSLDEEEEGLVTKAFCVEDFTAMIRSGEIADSSTLAAFGLLSLHGIV
ncbi:MAG: NUDIX hydrolase [Pseudomonadota bacterium]